MTEAVQNTPETAGTPETTAEETQPSETAAENQPEQTVSGTEVATGGGTETNAESQAGETQPAETGTEGQTEQQVIAGTEVPADNGTEAGTEASTESLTEEQTGTVAGTDTGAAAETETELSADDGTEAETGSGLSAETDTELPIDSDTELSADNDTETEINTELASNGDIEDETDEDWGWTWEDFLGEDEKESETNGLGNETVPEAGEADSESLTEEQETGTESLTEEPEAGTEGLTEEGTETELSSETGTETDTELSADGGTESETETELASSGDTEGETDEDWGWTWEDFLGEDEEESETDWYDWLFEDETDLEEETTGGDPKAGLETSEDWEASVAGVELTGVWGNDLAAVAETQLGEKEDMENYALGEDGEMKGITRYGQWYGEPYGDWDAMFVSFCLNYAEVPHSSVPRSGSCGSLAEMLQMYGLYEEPSEYEATKGDLVFLDTDEDGTADHAGILAEVTEVGELQVIAGDIEDEVKNITYAKGDAAVIGYGRLPQKPAQKLYHKIYNDGKVAVTAEYTAEAMIPEQAVLVVSEVPQDDAIYKQHYETVQEMMNAKEAEPETGTAEEIGEEEILFSTEEVTETEQGRETELHLRIYNIRFYLDEQEIEPQAEVKISIEFLDDQNFAAGTNKVIRIKEGEEPEALGMTRSEEEAAGQQMSKIEFTTKTF